MMFGHLRKLWEEARKEHRDATSVSDSIREDRVRATELATEFEQARRENNLAPRIDAAFKAKRRQADGSS